MMHRPIHSAVLAGFVATVVLSAMMVMKGGLDLVPELNVIVMLGVLLGTSSMAAAWITHFVIGTLLWGVLFGLVAHRLPGPYTARGVMFAFGPWLLMMIAMMPMVGAGIFGLNIGVIAPILTFVLHVVYGAVLGAFYGWLVRDHPIASADTWPGEGLER